MLKQALYTYTKSLHPKNLKEAKQKPDLWFCSMLLMNSVLQTEDGHRLQAFLFWSTILFPMMLMVWSNMNTKLPMPKAMFLAPMGMENRKQYIRAMMLIKISIPVIIGLLLRILWGILYGLQPFFSIFASTFAHFSFGIGMYVCSELRAKRDQLIRYAIRDANGIIKESWLNWICMIISVIMLLGFDVSGMNSHMVQENWGIFLGCLLLLLLIDIIIIKTQFHSTVEDICNYEVQFDLLGRV